MQMSAREFNKALRAVQHNLEPSSERELMLAAQVIASAAHIMHTLRNVSDDVASEFEPEEISEFIGSLSGRGRRLLKEVAEEIDIKMDRLH
jgi:hypothetical protein